VGTQEMQETSRPSSSPTKNPSGSVAQEQGPWWSPGFQPLAVSQARMISTSSGRILRIMKFGSAVRISIPPPWTK
jgi:hypothetical protein